MPALIETPASHEDQLTSQNVEPHLEMNAEAKEYGSGETVEPGLYLDIENGALVEVRVADALPEGVRVVTYARRFRKLDNTESVAYAA